jgi:hypothetical protein
MKNRALLFAASLCVAACATAQPRSQNFDAACPDEHGKCNVTITATGCSQDKIVAFPDRLGVDVSQKQVKIVWTITNSPGYTFKRGTDGIEFTAAGGEFDEPEWLDAKNYRFKDKNFTPGDFKYKIRLFKGGAECTKDPTIVNGASL